MKVEFYHRDHNINIFSSQLIRLWLVLNAIDILFTIWITRLGGAELMPIAGHFLNQGVPYFIVFKLLFALISAVVLLNINRLATKLCDLGMLIIVSLNFCSLIISLVLR